MRARRASSRVSTELAPGSRVQSIFSCSWKLPRWKRSFTRRRASKSTASQPGGKLVRRSTDLPLTDRASHDHAPQAPWPCARPNPVIPRIMPRPDISLRLLDRRRVHAGRLIGLAQLPVRINVLRVFGIAFSKHVAALAVGDEIQRLRSSRASARREWRQRPDYRSRSEAGHRSGRCSTPSAQPVPCW